MSKKISIEFYVSCDDGSFEKKVVFCEPNTCVKIAYNLMIGRKDCIYVHLSCWDNENNLVELCCIGRNNKGDIEFR